MSIIKHVTLQKIVAHDFRYDPCTSEILVGPRGIFRPQTEEATGKLNV